MVEEFTLAEATEACTEDWMSDTKGKGHLTAETFMDAIVRRSHPPTPSHPPASADAPAPSPRAPRPARTFSHPRHCY